METVSPSRSNVTLEGISFYGTSLILEDNVTIRHYFTVNDSEAFLNAGYNFSIDYGTKGDFIYFDITDIPAQELGNQFGFVIMNSLGEPVYNVIYAATNYMADMMDDGDASLVSLVSAMYDYYIEAYNYAN